MHVVLFDIDGTLLHTGGAGRQALAQAVRHEFGIPQLAAGIETAGRTDRGIVQEIFAAAGIEETADHWQRFCRAYLAALAEFLPRASGGVLPGAAELLAVLGRRADVALGLLTGNVRAGAELKLVHYRLAGCFQFGGFGDQHADRNEVARAAWVAAGEHVRRPLDPRHAWVVGDTPLDVRAARAIGARSVAVATGLHGRAALAASEPDLLLESLLDAEPLLAELG